jgi:hypothetical protein
MAGEMAIMWLAFYGVRAATGAMQRFGKHVSTIEADNYYELDTSSSKSFIRICGQKYYLVQCFPA